MAKRTLKYSPIVDQLSGPRSRAWQVTDHAFELERQGRDIIHLGIGDPDFATPTDIVDVAVQALQNGRTHYSPIPGEAELRVAITDAYARECEVDITEAQVTVFPGAQCALFATLLCLAGPEDEVILLEPFYATYEGVASAGGATVVTVPMSAANDFALDVERIAKAITPKTRVILANSPGNPSGAVYSKSSWQALLHLCEQNGIWLVSDEVYGGLVFEGQHQSPMALQNDAANVVVINSVSKSHAMTGWRLGWAISSPTLAAHLENLAQCLLFGVSQFTQDAVAYGLANSADAVGAMRQTFRARRDLLCNVLRSINKLTVHQPAGGMFVMVDVSRLEMDGEEFANALLDHSGIAVVPGFAFGDSVKNYVRIGYLIDAAELGRAADKIEKFVSGLAI